MATSESPRDYCTGWKISRTLKPNKKNDFESRNWNFVLKIGQ